MSLDTDASAISADVTPECIVFYPSVATNVNRDGTHVPVIF